MGHSPGASGRSIARHRENRAGRARHRRFRAQPAKVGPHHHLINAKTGLPAQGTKAIFVLARTGIEADAYATALFTAGFEEGIRLSENLPAEILSISSEDKMYKSKGFDAELFED
ncbi:MAG: FAD:protein FMN transferase [Candidatus Micrarchaeota archaeon]